jgi:hypothetical protein
MFNDLDPIVLHSLIRHCQRRGSRFGVFDAGHCQGGADESFHQGHRD